MGNWQFLIDSATSYPDLVQETVSGAEIKESGFISAMDWFGRLNFFVGSQGGHRKQTGQDKSIKIKFGDFPCLG